MRPFRWVSLTLLVAASAACSLLAQRPAALTSPEERAALHDGPEWAVVAPHLPNPATGSAAQLETAGDVLRARRFPEDALDYYNYAVQRGGNVSKLLTKMGVVRLELRQDEIARQMFLRVVRVDKKNSQAWNNLAVTEFSEQHYQAAISDYHKAIRYDRTSAVYRMNLAMAYFEKKDMESAQRELAMAMRLDPGIMHPREGGGITAHVVGSRNYPELCFEMAKMYAREKKPASVREWLAKASEGGYDVRPAMLEDAALRPYLADTAVKLLLSNAEEMRKHRIAATSVPSLGSASSGSRGASGASGFQEPTPPMMD